MFLSMVEYIPTLNLSAIRVSSVVTHETKLGRRIIPFLMSWRSQKGNGLHRRRLPYGLPWDSTNTPPKNRKRNWRHRTTITYMGHHNGETGITLDRTLEIQSSDTGSTGRSFSTRTWAIMCSVPTLRGKVRPGRTHLIESLIPKWYFVPTI